MTGIQQQLQQGAEAGIIPVLHRHGCGIHSRQIRKRGSVL
jgi:hypothetical protein